jgi:predicted DNA-binding transcriptional regulator AlpA
MNEENVKTSFATSIVLLPTNDILNITGLSRTTLWRLERAGKFPMRLRLSANRVGWRKDEVEEWIATRPRGMAG